MEDDTSEIRRHYIEQLCQSDRGKRSLKALSRFLDESLPLDSRNQAAVIALVESAFGPLCGTTRDLLREYAEQV